MKERPILMSAPMVRALMDGSSTTALRVVKRPKKAPPNYVVNPGLLVDKWRAWWQNPDYPAVGVSDDCPYGMTGDRLWVQETFKKVASGEVKNGYGEVRYGFAYKADAATKWNERTTTIHDLSGQPPTGPMQFKTVPWKSGVAMPRCASRFLLEIADVRIERLQDIKESVALYKLLWEPSSSMDPNPWVWVIEFEVCHDRP